MKTFAKKFSAQCWFFGLLGCFMLSSCLVKMSECETDPELGTNGGFEKVKNNLPINWMVNTSRTTSEGSFTWGFDTSEVKEGVQSYKCTVLSCSDKGGRFSPGIAQEFKAKAGDTYRIKCWIKQKNCSYRINISGVSATESSAGPFLQTVEATSDWKELQYEYTLPSGRKALRVEFTVLSPGTWWIDGFTIQKINPS